MSFAIEEHHGWMLGGVFTLLLDVPNATEWSGMHGPDGPIMRPHPLSAGTRVKVVMVSRFGDCGITDRLWAETGYITRVPPEALELTEGDRTTIEDAWHERVDAFYAMKPRERLLHKINDDPQFDWQSLQSPVHPPKKKQKKAKRSLASLSIVPHVEEIEDE